MGLGLLVDCELMHELETVHLHNNFAFLILLFSVFSFIAAFFYSIVLLYFLPMANKDAHLQVSVD